jgi:hypothetical protein
MKAFSVPLLLGLTIICAPCAVLRFPVPPKQHQPWHPEPAIPTNVVSAAEAIFEQGFPDPRGCEYREIEVEVCDVWDGKALLVTTHGWVLPDKIGTNHFAICWNGLIYPVANVSKRVDLDSEVSSNSFVRGGFDFNEGSALGEVASVHYPNHLSSRVLLLLRCGETSTALKNWSPNQRSERSAVGDFDGGQNPNGDPYLEFAGDWAWAMFDRMISAHQRGDEALALVTVHELAEVQPEIEAECALRGFQRPQSFTSDWRSQPGPYLGFLGQLPQILSDLERRAKEPAKINVIEAGITNYPDQTKRIAALIDDLDLVRVRQWGQPGWVDPAEDPIVSQLIQEGYPAVEPLLVCLDNDKRLTRSVGFGRDFFRGRTVISVHDAAKIALLSILRANFNDDAKIHAYWDKYKGLSLEDTWYAILNDDSAFTRWDEAAANIVQSENIQKFPGGFSISKFLLNSVRIRMDGEILRAKSNPSVSELMTRRALEVPTNNVNAYDISAACQMALDLAAWDPAASLPVTKTLSKRACRVMTYSGQKLGPLITKLALARAKGGDPEAFDDYTSWIVTTSPHSLGDSISDCLEPFKEFAINPTLQAAGEKLFGNTNSAWSRLPWGEMVGDNPMDSDLVNLPAFRQLLVRELGKTNVCGSISWHAPDQISYTLTNYQETDSFSAVTFPPDAQPANDVTLELRWCDWVAFSLSQGHRIPFCNPFAPVKERDSIIDNAKKILATGREVTQTPD